MKRALIVLLTGTTLLLARAEDPSWYPDERSVLRGQGGTAGALRISADVRPFQAWTMFAPIDPRRGVNASCRLDFEGALLPESKTQIRWGLFGRENDQWTGLAVVGGLTKDTFEFELWNTVPTATNVLSLSSNERVGQLAVKADPPRSGAPVRLVMMVRQNADGTCDVSGLFGTHAYEFKSVRLSRALPATTSFGVMNGKKSGVPAITVSRLVVGGLGK